MSTSFQTSTGLIFFLPDLKITLTLPSNDPANTICLLSKLIDSIAVTEGSFV